MNKLKDWPELRVVENGGPFDWLDQNGPSERSERAVAMIVGSALLFIGGIVGLIVGLSIGAAG